MSMFSELIEQWDLEHPAPEYLAAHAERVVLPANPGLEARDEQS
jgi:hypothetical protein